MDNDTSAQIDKILHTLETQQEQISTLQKTIDRLYQDVGEWQDDNNRKINEIKEKQGILEKVHTDISETFKDMATRFNIQKREITDTVETTIQHEMKPVTDKVNSLVKNKPKVLHYIQRPRTHFWKFWRKS